MKYYGLFQKTWKEVFQIASMNKNENGESIWQERQYLLCGKMTILKRKIRRMGRQVGRFVREVFNSKKHLKTGTVHSISAKALLKFQRPLTRHHEKRKTF